MQVQAMPELLTYKNCEIESVCCEQLILNSFMQQQLLTVEISHSSCGLLDFPCFEGWYNVISLTKSTWNTIPRLKEREVWGCGLFGNGLAFLAWSLGSILSTTTMMVVEQLWNYSTG